MFNASFALNAKVLYMMTYICAYCLFRKDRGGKRALLVLVSMVFGMEIGFKFATKQLIYLLNPCHVTTAIQVHNPFICPEIFVVLHLPVMSRWIVIWWWCAFCLPMCLVFPGTCAFIVTAVWRFILLLPYFIQGWIHGKVKKLWLWLLILSKVTKIIGSIVKGGMDCPYSQWCFFFYISSNLVLTNTLLSPCMGAWTVSYQKEKKNSARTVKISAKHRKFLYLSSLNDSACWPYLNFL